MKDYIFLEWSYDNNFYTCMNEYAAHSNLRFLMNFYKCDYKRNYQKIFVQAINIYNTIFIYNDLQKEILYIGDISLKDDKITFTENYFNQYLNDKNSCQISHRNFIELTESLTRIQLNPAPFIIIYRNNDSISLKDFRFKEDMELFVQIINERLPLLRKEIDYIFIQMQNFNDIMQVNDYFEQLENIHSYLAKLVFKEEVDVTADFRQFLRDFDRIDDLWWREYIFNKIKTENYSLDGKSAMDQ